MTAIRNVLVTTCLASATGLMPVPLLAQRGQTSEISGVVTDASHGVFPGATVAIASPQLIGGPQRAVTDAEGRYRFPVLLPGIYEITAAADGFKTVRRSAVELPPGLGITVDFYLELAPVTQVIHVEGASAPIDVHSSAAPALIDRALIDHLPIGRENLVFGYATLTPGVVNGAVFGVPGFVVPFSLDGTDGTAPAYGQPKARPNANWLEEIQVVSLGAGAQYGEYGTARVNGITRSGSNRFSGLSEFRITKPSWTGNNRGALSSTRAERFRPIEIVDRWDTSQQAGGPMRTDRLWFFAAAEYYKNTERSFGFSSVPRLPDEPLTETREPKVLVKLTGAPAPRLRLEGYTLSVNSRVVNGNAGPLVRPEAYTSWEDPERMQNARLTWVLNDRTLVEAHAGHYWGHYTPTGSLSGPPGHYDTLTGVTSVNAVGFSDVQRRITSASASLTRYMNGAAGRTHELKAGADYQRDFNHDFSGLPGGMVFLDYGGQPDIVAIDPEGSRFRATFWRTSLFVQDVWRASSRITVEPGVRATFYDTSVPAQGATFFKSTFVSPRLGVAWDVSSNHKTVVRAHYGHYQHPVVANFVDFLDPGAQTAVIVAKVLGPTEFEPITLNTNSGSTNDRIDPEAEALVRAGVPRRCRARGVGALVSSRAVRAAELPRRARVRRRGFHVDPGRGD